MNLKMIINSYGLQIGVIAMTTINMCLVFKLKDKFEKYKAMLNSIQNDFEANYRKKLDKVCDDLNNMYFNVNTHKEDIEELKKTNIAPKYLPVKRASRPRKNKSAKGA